MTQRLGGRVYKLEQEAGNAWPAILYWQDIGETDEHAAAEVAKRIRAAGWQGAIEDYPARPAIIRFAREGELENDGQTLRVGA